MTKPSTSSWPKGRGNWVCAASETKWFLTANKNCLNLPHPWIFLNPHPKSSSMMTCEYKSSLWLIVCFFTDVQEVAGRGVKFTTNLVELNEKWPCPACQIWQFVWSWWSGKIENYHELGFATKHTPLKVNIDTQNDAIFERRYILKPIILVIYGEFWGVRYFENVWTQIPGQKVQAKCPLKKNMASSSLIFGMKKHPDIWVWNHHLNPSKQRLWNIWDPRTQIVAAIFWKISPIKCIKGQPPTKTGQMG